MARGSRLIFSLAAVLLGITVNGEEFQCTNQVSEYCSCSRSIGEYELDCPPQDISIIIHYKPRDSIKIMCTSGVKEGHWPKTVQLLSGLKLGRARSFIVRMCPGLPPFPVNELMERVGASEVNSFHLMHMSHLNASEYLTRNHLKGLENIKQLDLNSNRLTYLPDDLLADMSHLTWLDLKNNRVILPKNIFRPVPKLEVLELGSNNLTFLEPGIFRNLTKLRLLNLWGNRLQNLTRPVFTDIANLESLDLNSNHLVSLVPDLFADLTNLKSLNLYNNDFVSLPKGLFLSNPNLEKFQINHNRRTLRIPPELLSNLPNLKEVKMSHCNLTHLPEDLLYGSTSLTNITFKFNSISHIPEDLFRDNTELLSIDLSHNRLSTIPNHVFSNLKKLAVLNLASNNITHIRADTLAGLSSLQFLHLEYNVIDYVHNMAFQSVTQLRKLNLSHNNIKKLQLLLADKTELQSVLFATTQLEELYLSYNNLTEIYDDWRNTHPNLKTIDLAHNSFTYISINDLTFISDSLKLDLSFNNISIVDFDVAERLAIGIYNSTNFPENKSVRLKLNGNPVACDCRINSFVRYLRKEMEPEVYYIVDVDSTELTCSENGMELSKIDPRVLTCEENEGCPNFCKCYYRPYDTALIVDCSSVKYTSPPDLNFISPQVMKHINQTIVDLSNNTISSLPANFNSIGYNKTTKLYLSHNRLRNISLSSLNPNIQVLKLDYNNLTRLDNQLINFLHKSKMIKQVTLGGNPWACNCDAKYLLHFMQSNYAKVANLKNVTCLNGQSMANMTLSDLCPTSNLIIGLSSLIIALLGLVIGGLFALYYRYQREIKVWLYAHNMCLWFVTEEELDKDKQYDAFISYSHHDEDFINNKLAPGLENGSTKYKLCLHYRDWVVGDFIPSQIARSVQESKRTIIVLSPAFIESVWGLMEFRTAHQQALSEGRCRVIVILYGDIGPADKFDPELKAYLSMNTYVKWGDPWFWEKLRYALPHPVKNQNLPLTTLHETKLIKNGSTPTINSNIIEALKPV